MLFGCLTLNGAGQLVAILHHKLVERRLKPPHNLGGFSILTSRLHPSSALVCGRARQQHSSSRRHVGCLAKTLAKGVGAEEDAEQRGTPHLYEVR